MKPVVAIVGRPNVGKSALFNRLTGKQIALVYDRPGVTRDRISIDRVYDGYEYSLLDTGGIGLEDKEGFEDAIENEVNVALEMANQILFVVDGREGLNPLDEEVARKLRRANLPVFLIVNKVDTAKQDDAIADFARLGMEHMYATSAAHGRGVQEVMDALLEIWKRDFPDAKVKEEPEPKEGEEAKVHEYATRIAIVGRPNVGKSSMINALVDENRVIVSPVAGTTRDSVDVEFDYNEKPYCLIDTAGMRKRKRIHDPLEQAMAGRSAHSINRAHVCALVLDASAGVEQQDKKIAGLIQDANRPCVIVINKWDLVSQSEVAKGGKAMMRFRLDYEDALRQELFFLKYAPVIFTSAIEGKELERFLDAIAEVAENRLTDLPAGRMNRVLQEAVASKPPPRSGHKRFKLYYAAQIKDKRDTPTVALFINDSSLFSDDYRKYIERELRKEIPMKGCPIRWLLRDKKKVASDKEKAAAKEKRQG